MDETKNGVQSTGKHMTSFGVVVIILGMLAMLAPGLTGFSVLVMLAVLVMGTGILRIIWAFKSGSFGRGVLMFLGGGLTLACGLAMLANPLFTMGVLTLVLISYFIVDGVCETIAGFQNWGGGGGWLLFGGIVSILLGVLLWRQFPLSGVWAMGTLLGIKMFFIGLTMITTGTAVRSEDQALGESGNVAMP